MVNAEYFGCTDEIGDWGISLQNTDKASFGIGGFCDDTYDVQSVTPINDGQWHFVCCTRNGTTGEYKIYVDEGPAEDARFHLPVFPRKPVPMFLASTNNEPGKFLDGRIDELVFYNHVLTQMEIDLLRIYGVLLPGKAVLIAPPIDAVVPYQVTLQWTHPNVVDTYKVYLDTNPLLVAEPNLPSQPMILEGEQVPPASPADPNASRLFDSVEVGSDYYWRVDTLVIEPNWACLIPETNEPCWNIYTWVEGDIWSFQAMEEYITFNGSLEDQYILPDPITHQMPAGPEIAWSVQVVSTRPIVQAEWIRNGIPLYIDGLNYSEDTTTGPGYQVSSTLTIHDAGEEQEGTYQYRVTLDTMEEFDSPPASLYVSSELVVHRYSFTGNLDDSIGDANGVLVDPNIPNITFLDGHLVFDSGEGGGSPITLSGDPNAHFADLPNGLISALGNNMTLMVWFTWDDPGEQRNQRIFDFGMNAEGLEGQSSETEGGNYLMLTPKHDSQTNPKLQFAARFDDFTETLTANPPEVEQQVCATITWSSTDQKMRLYINGQPADEADLNGKLSDLDDRNNWLGRSQQAADPLFVGRYNELRIYNIPLDEVWIKALYEKGPDNDPLNADPCLLQNDLDINGDCVVDIVDFATFAENWLWCGLLSCQE